MGTNQRQLLHKAIHRPGWHCFAPDMQVAIDKLKEYGFIEVKKMKMQYRLIGNEQLFQLQADVNDMNESHRTQFSRCECGHLHDTDVVCEHCRVDKS